MESTTILQLDEAGLRQRRDDLGADIRNIAAQLADRDKRDANGRRLGPIEWHTWRQSALVAQRHKIDELQAVKRRLHEIQQAKDEAKREATKATENSNGTPQDWKPILMRALDESQKDRDRLVLAIQEAITSLASAKAGTKAAHARDILTKTLYGGA